jgi:hypothetical protein
MMISRIKRIASANRFPLITALLAAIMLMVCSTGLVGNWFNFGQRLGTKHSQQSFENAPIILAQAPCLGSICIGMVDREAVVAELLQDELLYGIRDNGGKSISFYIAGSVAPVAIFFAQSEHQQEFVDRINLQLTDLHLDIVLDTLGEPDEIFLMYGCGRGYHVHGKLLYKDEGIEVQVQYPVGRHDRTIPVKLEDNTSIAWVWYFDPAIYDQWLLGIHEDLAIRNGYFDISPSINAETLVATVRPWPGLGTPIQALDLCPR